MVYKFYALLYISILLSCQSKNSNSPDTTQTVKGLLVDKIWTLREAELETKVTYKGRTLNIYEVFDDEIVPGQTKIIFRSDETYHVFKNYAANARLRWEIKDGGKTIGVSYRDNFTPLKSANLEDVLVTEKRLRFKYLHTDSNLTPSSFYITAYGDAN